MHRYSLWTAIFPLLLLAGCSAGPGGASTPTAADFPGSPTAADSILPSGHLLTSQWTLHVGQNGAASLAEAPERNAAAENQGRYFDLDIARFISAQTLRVTGFNFDINGDVLVEISHSHPFRAPDFTLPITAGNRADLSYTGKLLILADQEHVSFTDYDLSCDPGVLRSPDGYAATGDLLRNAGLTNNLFPYRLLVDEARNNRVDVSNGGLMTGNYDVDLAGWNQANAGPDGDGWTGYDMLHAGQSVTLQLAIPRARIEAGDVNVGLAILIKYTDPRGTPGPTRRFPLDPPDAVEFSYRMPHGAFDVGECASCAELSLQNVEGATADFNVTVRDWDVVGEENGDDTLWDESAPNKILPGSGGMPTVVVDVPGVLTAPVTATPTGGDGIPPGQWTYSGSITMPAGGTIPGLYWGIAAAIDPEPTASGYPGQHFGVDPNTLVADPARALPLVNYSVFPLEVPPWNGWGIDAGAPRGTPSGLAVGADGTTVIAYNTNRAFDIDPGTCLDWRAPAGTTSKDDTVLAWIDVHGNIEHVLMMGGSLDERGQDLAIDDTGAIYAVGESRSDDFDFDPGPGERIIPANGYRLAYLAKYTREAGLSWAHAWGEAAAASNGANAWDVALGADGTIAVGGDSFGMGVDLDPGPGFAPGADGGIESYVSTFNSAGVYQWSRTWWSSGLTFLRSVHIASGGDVLVGGSVEASVDLDPGPGEDSYPADTFTDAWLVRLDSAGLYEWGHGWGGQPSAADVVWHISEQPGTQHILASGMYRLTCDFDPGPGIVERTSFGGADSYISMFDEDGAFLDVAVWGSSEDESGWGGLVAPDGSIYLCGNFRETVDFDPGAGTHELTAFSLGDPYLLHLDPDLSFDWVSAVGVFGTSGQGIKVGLDLVRNEPVMLFRNDQYADVHPGPEEVILDASEIGLVRYAPDGTW